MWNKDAPSSAICVAIEKRNRLAFATKGLRVRGETRPADRANRRKAQVIELSGEILGNQWISGSPELPTCRLSNRTPSLLLIGRRVVSRWAVRFFTRGTSR